MNLLGLALLSIFPAFLHSWTLYQRGADVTALRSRRLVEHTAPGAQMAIDMSTVYCAIVLSLKAPQKMLRVCQDVQALAATAASLSPFLPVEAEDATSTGRLKPVQTGDGRNHQKPLFHKLFLMPPY